MKKLSVSCSGLAVRLYATFSILLLNASLLIAQEALLFPQNQAWKFRNVMQEIWYPAEVPGCVHTDLLRLGLIPDPYTGTHEHDAQWVDTCNWEYEKTLQLPQGCSEQDNFELIFEGLDTRADIFLNNELKLQADNMYRKWSLSISGKVLKNKAVIRIVFYSPTKTICELAQKGVHRLPDDRAYLRKAPYHFGWDWGPTLPTSGIWKPVYLKKIQPIDVKSIFFHQQKLNDKSAEMKAECIIQSLKECSVTLKISYSQNKSIEKNFRLKKGENICILPFTIKSPKLWWPNGHGNPTLYTFNVWVTEHQKTVVMQQIKTGLRTIELIRQPDSIGESFYFKVNGKPIYAKGANYIPMDNFPSQVSLQKYRKLVSQAREAGVNMLRVWGGGIYERDEFYSLLDENGILCWQDFMFACNLYPGDSLFLENVRQEAAEQVVRLRQHPSIALWCGNNESDEGYKNWGWNKSLNWSAKDSVEIWQNYEKLFHELLPDVVRKLDSSRSYWPSSPSIGWGHKESLTHGDSHYWGVWWGMEPFTIYRQKIGRFMSEYGFQGMPDMRTLEFAIPQNERYLFSSSLKQHQKHPTGYETIGKYMEYEFPSTQNFNQYQYFSQILQAEGIRTAMEAHRRAMPVCMGTLFWQWNDSWPVTSWSAIDWFGYKKALYYTTCRSFKPMLPSYVVSDSLITFYFTSEKKEIRKARLNLTFWSVKQTESKEINFETYLGTQTVYTLSKTDFPDLFNPQNRIICALWIAGNDTLSREIILPVQIKKYIPPKAELDIRFSEKNGRQYISLKSNFPVKYCRLSSELDIDFSDNYFDLLPDLTATIELRDIDIPFNPEKLFKGIKIEWLGNSNL